jgi:GTP-binding protein
MLKLVVQLIDIRTGPTDDDILMINMMIDRGIDFIVVATKADKLSKTAMQNRIEELEREYFLGTDIKLLPFSSVNREGRDELWKKIFSSLDSGT